MNSPYPRSLQLSIALRWPVDWRQFFARRPLYGDEVLVLPTFVWGGYSDDDVETCRVMNVYWAAAGPRRKQLVVELTPPGTSSRTLTRPLDEFSYRVGLTPSWLLQLI